MLYSDSVQPSLKLLARKGQPLLVRRDAFLVLDLGLDIVNGVRCLGVPGDGRAFGCAPARQACNSCGAALGGGAAGCRGTRSM